MNNAVVVFIFCLVAAVLVLQEESLMERLGYTKINNVDSRTDRYESDGGEDNAKENDEEETAEQPSDGEGERGAREKLFTFYDGNPNREETDYDKYSMRDVPESEFSESAWQGDAVYMNHFLDAAISLVDRTIEGIVEEYGGNSKIWKIPKIEGDAVRVNEPGGKVNGEYQDFSFYEKSSFDGLSRRLLHSMMTSSPFTVVLAGHSAAAGHGNNFNQSSMVQFHRVMEPLMKNLGVELKSKNMAMGTHPTVLSALAGRTVYGDDVDVMIWDTSMTEGLPNRYPGAKEFHKNSEIMKDAFIEFLFRTQMTSGEKIPFFITYPEKNIRKSPTGSDFLRDLNENGHADVGRMSIPVHKLPLTTSKEQAMNMSNAYRCLEAEEDVKSWCGSIKCEGICWKERPDIVAPTKQLEQPKGCVSWHPGWRFHRFTGRNLAMYILLPLRHALDLWQEKTNEGDIPISGDFWHMTEKRDLMRHAARNADSGYDSTRCGQLLHELFDYDVNNPMGPKDATSHRVCQLKLTGATEYTPQNLDIEDRTLRGRLVSVKAPEDKKEFYDGYDDVVMLKDYVEPGFVDVESIAAGWNGIPELLPSSIDHARSRGRNRHLMEASRDLAGEKTLEDLGWGYWRKRVGICGGTPNTRCGRQSDEGCILDGRHDGPGGFEVYSGQSDTEWLEFRLGKVSGGWIGAHFLLGRASVEVDVEVLRSSDGMVVHSGSFHEVPQEPTKKITGPHVYERQYVRLRNLWNNPSAEEIEYNVRLKVKNIEMAAGGNKGEAVYLLTHLYWSV